MRIELHKVKSLGFGSKYCLLINGIPTVLVGKHKAQQVKQVACNMMIDNDVLLSRQEQGYIISEINKVLNRKGE